MGAHWRVRGEAAVTTGDALVRSVLQRATDENVTVAEIAAQLFEIAAEHDSGHLLDEAIAIAAEATSSGDGAWARDAWADLVALDPVRAVTVVPSVTTERWRPLTGTRNVQSEVIELVG